MEMNDLIPIKDWDEKLSDDLLVMAGPCSAESEEQMLDTARGLPLDKVKVFRAGIWKPRTRPNAFEGVGSIGLPWFRAVKKETGLLSATEVANVKHVYEALKAGIDIIWIGARTTANPFAMQEIADALVGVDIPVLVKNPVNADVELWLGGIERLYGAGLRKLGAIHRGFSSYEKSIYRNAPQWQLPIELKRRLPNLPIVCDPSHICGNTTNLFEVSQRALDLHYNGLIIETHINPSKALSDNKQQVTPAQLSTEILDRLVIRQIGSTNPEAIHSLEEMRADIDGIDRKIINLLGERMKISDKMGLHKKQFGITVLQEKRWDEILKNRYSLGELNALSNEFIEALFKAIHQESINHQEAVLIDNK